MRKILYSVTVKISLDVHDQWIDWMNNIHIPEIMKTDYFESYRFCKLLSQDESEGITYSIQYICSDMKTLHQYTINHGNRLQQEHHIKFKDKYVLFRSLLEILEDN